MTKGDDKCEIYFGRPKPSTPLMARLRRRSGFQVLRWTEGNFQIDFNGKSSQERRH